VTFVLGRALDDSYAAPVRQHITLLTVARLSTNSVYRFAPPYLATIASDTGVTLGRLGVALAMSELGGLVAPSLGTVVDRLPRRGCMVGGLLGVALAALAAAAAPTTFVFGLALLTIGLTKTTFDMALGGWIADQVPYSTRGRVVGLTELSWAGGLLIGVPIMGLITASTGWRGGYVVASVAVVVVAGAVAARLPDVVRPPEVRPPRHERVHEHVHLHEQAHVDEPVDEHVSRSSEAGWRRAAIPALASICLLMMAAQFAFVTFGSWLEDELGFGAGALAIVVFAIGVCELVASSATIRLTDAWGKQRSVSIGAALMVPCGMLLATPLHEHAALGLPLLGLYIIGFEFAIVSSLPLTSNLVPSRPSSGLGLGFGAGTLGRAAASIPATVLYERHGFGAPMFCGALAATACAVTMFRITPRSDPLRAAPAARSTDT
jgi:MFS transporter, DHA1 family, inner membrane transport protein